MLNVVYEDNQIIVVVKPQNIPSQEDESKDLDMLTMVKNYVKEKYNKPGNVYIGLVHRLDRPTGGLMVFARTSKSAERLSKQIREKTFKKWYLTIVEGVPKEYKAMLIDYLIKDKEENIVKIASSAKLGAKEAKLEYTTLNRYKNNLSLLKVELFTGRSHQIRVQLSNIGNSIVGDVKYGSNNKISNNLCLWAYKIQFKHPTLNKEMQFCFNPPVKDIPWSYFNINAIN